MKEQYLAQLNEKERAALEVARRMLGSSFVLEKTIGFLQFQKKWSSAVK